MTSKVFRLKVEEGVDGELYLQLNDEILDASGFKIGDTIKWIDNGDSSWSLIKMDDDLKYYMVDVLSSFRNRFVVKAKSLEHAYDEVVCRESDCNFVEFSQKHLGTNIIDGFEVSEDELLAHHAKDNDYISSWSKEVIIEKLTNSINYND